MLKIIAFVLHMKENLNYVCEAKLKQKHLSIYT